MGNPSRLLAIDFGTKRTGVAVNLFPVSIVVPLGTLPMDKGKEKWIEPLILWAKEYETEGLLVGLPLEMDGTEGKAVQRVRSYCQLLSQFLPLPIVEWDERLTSEAAKERLAHSKAEVRSKKGVLDQVAATILLESYLRQTV